MSPDNTVQYDLFICHAEADKGAYVTPIVDALQRRGLSCWLDSRNLNLGDSITMGVNEGLRHSRYLLLCLSEAFLGRSWPEAEMAAALAIQNRLGQKRVLPIVLNSSEKVFARYPLLADKHHLSGVNPEHIASVVFGLVTTPESPLRPGLELDAEVSDHLVLFSKSGNQALAVLNFLVQVLAESPDGFQRHWVYYTLGRIGGSRALSILRDAENTEEGLALKGAKAGLRLLSDSSPRFVEDNSVSNERED